MSFRASGLALAASESIDRPSTERPDDLRSSEARVHSAPIDAVDAQWYRETYRDVPLDVDPADHYANRGWREGRDPNAHFSTTWYLRAYPDIAAADLNPFDHFLRHGRAEGRSPNERSAWNASGRFTAVGGVDREWYRKAYPDVGEDCDPAEHYALVGWREGRDPNAEFSTTGYLVRYPDIARTGGNPLLHYLEHGRYEGRTSPKLSMADFVRAQAWWPTKFSWLCALAYATALLSQATLISSWPAVLLALAALVPAAAYAAVVNDVTDVSDDIASGKANRLHGRSMRFRRALLAACIVPGCIAAGFMRAEPLLLACYLGTWAAFSLYSIAPVRLKTRGFAGVLADAAGAHVFPTVFIIGATCRWLEVPLNPLWCGAAVLVSACYGVRGIVAHQVMDRENDVRGGVHTFVARHSARFVGIVIYRFVFPLEVAALGLMLWQLSLWPPLVLLTAYVFARWWDGRALGEKLSLSFLDDPAASRSAVTLYPYYNLYFPLAVLASASLVHAADALVALAHVIAFGSGPLRAAAARGRVHLIRAVQ
jgi:4-hydroxybenzoate polyprenyltransferase